MHACFAEETSLTSGDLYHHLQKKEKRKKPSLIRSANQAPMGIVPREAAHTDLLDEAYPPLGELPENCTTLWKL